MTVLDRIRMYHATLAVLAILAYVTGEAGIIHAWLGYGVAAVIAFRLAWALVGSRQVGLIRFYPSFDGLGLDNAFTHPAITRILLLGIAVCLVTVTLTGIAIDSGQAVGLADSRTVSLAYADGDEREEHGDDEDGLISEAHEFFANLMLLFVGMHVAYLVAFKRPLARFMLFLPNGPAPRR